ncbi:MAG: cadherin domain-containing protein, partial [Verrucomicrobia bacterium]|nr:cadherin domain-containing protein [Verrucomicrobiota bacterium]
DTFDYEGGVNRFLIRARVNSTNPEDFAEQVFVVHLLDDPYENNPYDSEQGGSNAYSGDTNSSDYEQFGVVTPIGGWSDANDTAHYAGQLGSSDMNSTIDDGLRLYAALTLVENEPVGTLVGRLGAEDADNGAVLSYTFTEGQGSNNNSLFHLDSNGTLTSKEVLDYEVNASEYSIRARVTDERNASLERAFTVYLLDVFEDLDGDGTEDHLDDDMDGDGYTNEEELAYPSDPRDPNSVANRPPHSLFANAPLRFYENQPVGTEVGSFSAQDPEAGPISFLIATGEYEGNASQLFVIDENGTLRTAVVFDYESNVTQYSIRVKAVDDRGDFVTKEFPLKLMDVDDTPPEIILRGGDVIVHPYRTKFVDPGAIAFDAVDGNLTDLITIEGVVRPDVLESFSLTYRVLDNSGNAAEPVVRTVIMDDSNFDRTPKQLKELNLLGVDENRPQGTFVGEFNATDPDEGVITYRLVNGVGGKDNSRFVLDLNGTLQTNEIFDYEEQNQLSIRVRAQVRTGHALEQVFTVNVWDQVAPLVETMIPEQREGGMVWVGGKVIDTADARNWISGLYVSFDVPFNDPKEDGVRKLPQGRDLFDFGQEFIPGEDVKKIYVMAYSENQEGTNLGLLEKIEVVKTDEYQGAKQRDIWTGARAFDSASGWWNSSWFGNYYKASNGWWFHMDLGWIYPSGASGDGLWLWKKGLNWVWTKQYVYPFLFSHDTGSWFYFYGELNQKRMLYDYQLRSWRYLDDTGVDESKGDEVAP